MDSLSPTVLAQFADVARSRAMAYRVARQMISP
jgi:hypothetical protein